MHHPPHPRTYDPERPVTHHILAPAALQQEKAVPSRMPRSLRVLRAMFSAAATIFALNALYYVFLLLSTYVYTPPNFEEWLVSRGHFRAELWAVPVLCILRTVFYTAAAVRLEKGGRTGRRRAVAALGVDAVASVVNAFLVTAILIGGAVSVVGLVVYAFSGALFTVVGLVCFEALFLLFLLAEASREWFRATGA